MTLIPHWQPSEVAQPSKQALYFPAAFVTSKLAPILRARFASIASMWRDHFNALSRQLFIERVTVIGSVSNQSLGQLRHKTGSQGGFNKGHFMRASTCDAYGDRKTSAVCHCHDLRTFAPLGLSHPKAPFFAITKVPSMKHSWRSRPPRSLRSWASARKIVSITLIPTQRWYRRWQVWYGGYRSGRSCQGAPVLSIQSTPFSTSRGSRQGRPRLPFGTRSSSGMSGSSIVHCSSVKSIAHLVQHG